MLRDRDSRLPDYDPGHTAILGAIDRLISIHGFASVPNWVYSRWKKYREADIKEAWDHLGCGS